jgi:hypothetical protein
MESESVHKNPPLVSIQSQMNLVQSTGDAAVKWTMADIWVTIQLSYHPLS